jgi:hypothetical protein
MIPAPRGGGGAGARVPRMRRGVTPSAALALALLALPAATAAASAATADWLPLTLVRGVREGVHGRPAGGRARRLREAAYVLEGSTTLGYYTAPMQLGSPPKTFHLILDSGSSLTVVPCKACDCGFHQVRRNAAGWGGGRGGAGGGGGWGVGRGWVRRSSGGARPTADLPSVRQRLPLAPSSCTRRPATPPPPPRAERAV